MSEALWIDLRQALTEHWLQRAKDKVEASPEEHCEAMANVVMGVLKNSPEMTEMRAQRALQLVLMDAETQTPGNSTTQSIDVRIFLNGVWAQAQRALLIGETFGFRPGDE